mmetsp:Transcript_4317/g.9568  ORF Transcript_4317/g.9568 Transcript_4317/m.9568 type:complete len:131 (-) Transcript_4317:45-437(-)
MDTLNLTSIVANNNSITVLPDDLFSMTSLQVLVLSHNLIFVLPEGMLKSPNLKVLVLTDNRLETLPGSLEGGAALTELVQLYLDKNHFHCLPKQLNRLPRLTHLDLSNNYLSKQVLISNPNLNVVVIKWC